MTTIFESVARPRSQRRAAMSQLLGQLYSHWLDWRRLRRDQTALMRQPDHLLRDIGIERHEIERALHGRGSGLY